MEIIRAIRALESHKWPGSDGHSQAQFKNEGMVAIRWTQVSFFLTVAQPSTLLLGLLCSTVRWELEHLRSMCWVQIAIPSLEPLLRVVLESLDSRPASIEPNKSNNLAVLSNSNTGWQMDGLEPRVATVIQNKLYIQHCLKLHLSLAFLHFLVMDYPKVQWRTQFLVIVLWLILMYTTLHTQFINRKKE